MNTRTKLGIAAAALAVAGLAAPLAAAQIPSDPAPARTTAPTSPTSPNTASACTTQQHLERMWLALPKELRTDLGAAKQKPAGDQRNQAMKAVLDKAATGAYGDRVKQAAQRIQKADGRVWAKLPAALQTDLIAVRDADAGKATLDAAATVIDKAAAGTYGDVAKKVVEKLEQRPIWTSCKAR
jgi:hypothetical protein